MSASNGGIPSAFYHWHPVLLSSELGSRPAGVKVLGHQMVLFRAANGTVGALNDRCPHRGARLSTGWVENDSVVCPYHLWHFDCNGCGHSPVNPRMKPFTTAFEAVESHGIVWLKARDSDAKLPEIATEGLHFAGQYSGVINAPFPIVVDNFTEIEHSPTNHFMFAFDAEGIKEVQPQVNLCGDFLHIVYAGPQRQFPWWTFGRALGIKAGTRSVIDFNVHFGPIHWIYNILWEDPQTGARLPQHIREFAFITPRDDQTTAVFLLFFTTIKLLSPANPVLPLVRRMFLSRVKYEFLLDKNICENVAGMDTRTDFDGMQLGKFDHVLRTTRKLINSAYYRAG